MKIDKPKKSDQRFNWCLTPISPSINLAAVFIVMILAYSPTYSQTGDELMANPSVRAFEDAIEKGCDSLNGVDQDRERRACANDVMSGFLRTRPKFNPCGKHQYFGGSNALFKCIYSIDRNASVAPSSAASQQAQQQAQQAQEAARVAQTRADQARQGKRKTHDPAAEAHQCIDVDTRTLYGGFKNTCSYPVTYGYCVDNPRKGVTTDSPLFSCAGMAGKQTAGGQTIKANGYDTNHTKGGDGVYFFACKAPAHALDLSFVPGQGIQGRCGSLMGN